jgi:hypothetical protein
MIRALPLTNNMAVMLHRLVLAAHMILLCVADASLHGDMYQKCSSRHALVHGRSSGCVAIECEAPRY